MRQLLTGKAGQEMKFQSMKPLDLATCTKPQIKTYFEETYDFDENLFLCIKDISSMLLCPNQLRLPIIFYYGHTAVVFVNKLFISGFIKERVDFEFEKIFETGVDENSWDNTCKFRMGGALNWPQFNRIVDYRRRVRELILDTIDSTPLLLPITWNDTWWSLILGMDHARIHIELSSVMLRELPVELVQRPSAWSYGPTKTKVEIKQNHFIEVPMGSVKLGKPKDFPAYGWDNEFGSEVVETPAFRASQYLVTNEQFLKFVEAGGYKTKELWTEEGWEWVVFAKPLHPHFWVCQLGCESICGGKLNNYSHCKPETNLNSCSEHASTSSAEFKSPNQGDYLYRAMFDVIEIPWSWPVDVNYHEAKAFCNWTGNYTRLPTEAEHHLMRGRELPAESGNCSDPAFNDKPNFNSNLQFCSSTPVNLFPPSDAGFYDTYGNVWEWTECHFNGLKGFKTHNLYDDYSTSLFDGRHNLILGGSFMSSGCFASRYCRNAFRRHFFQHAGFRLVEAINKDDTPVRLCSSQPFVIDYGFVNSTPSVFGLNSESFIPSSNKQFTIELDDGFNQEITSSLAYNNVIIEYIRKLDHGSGSFIHIGCGIGMLCFELSNEFNSVLGIDYSGRLINFCLNVKNGKEHEAFEGFQIGNNSKMENLEFKQFTWLANEIPSCDIVLVTLLDRVMNPSAWTLRLFEIVKNKRMAIICTKIKLSDLEQMMVKFQLKGSETPFKDSTLLTLSFWERLY